MADKETRLRFKIDGISRGKKEIDDLGKAYDDAAKKVKKLADAASSVGIATKKVWTPEDDARLKKLSEAGMKRWDEQHGAKEPSLSEKKFEDYKRYIKRLRGTDRDDRYQYLFNWNLERYRGGSSTLRQVREDYFKQKAIQEQARKEASARQKTQDDLRQKMEKEKEYVANIRKKYPKQLHKYFLDPDFTPTIEDLKRDRPPGWQDRVAELKAGQDDHTPNVGRRGSAGRGAYSNATWFHNRYRSFYRGIPMAIGAAAGAGMLFGFGELLGEAKNSELQRKQLAIQLGQGPGSVGEMGQAGAALGLSGTQTPEFFRSYTRIAGSSPTSIAEASAAGHWADKMGLYADRQQVVGSYANARRMGAFGPGSISKEEYMGMMEKSIYNAGMKGRDLEYLEAINVSLEHIISTKGSLSPEATTGVNRFLTTMSQTGIPGLQGMHGAQYLNALHQGMMSPGGGATGLYMLAQATNARTPWELRRIQEEGPFGEHNYLEKSILPYLINTYGNSGMDLGGLLHSMMPQTNISLNDPMIKSFKDNGMRFTPAERAKYSAEAMDTGTSLIKELAATRETFIKLAGDFLPIIEDLTRILKPLVDVLEWGIAPILKVIEVPLNMIADVLTGRSIIGEQLVKGHGWLNERIIAPTNKWADGWQSQGASAIDKALGRATGIIKKAPGAVSDAVKDAAIKYGLPESLIWSSVINESGGNATAVSPAGAKGLMQTIDSTSNAMGITNPFDPVQSIFGGTKYLRQLVDRYNGNFPLAVAAYNAGPGAVDKYGGIPPYPETQTHVSKVMDLYNALGGGSVSSKASGGSDNQSTTINIYANGIPAEQFRKQVTGSNSAGEIDFNAANSLTVMGVQ